MSSKKYRILLNDDERAKLEKVGRSSRRSAREKLRARILLLADESDPNQNPNENAVSLVYLSDSHIAKSLRCAPITVSKLRNRAAVRGVVESVSHKFQQNRKDHALDGEKEAQLIATVCSAPPTGRKRWTLRLIKDRLIERSVVESIGCETIRRTLKKTS
jgi:PhoPQ-activated pathogenicity-related protein